MTKRFKIVSKLGSSIKSCVKNDSQTIEMFNVVFGRTNKQGYDERIDKLIWYVNNANIHSIPFCIVSPLGSITVERIK